jgi:hypothetical protein
MGYLAEETEESNEDRVNSSGEYKLPVKERPPGAVSLTLAPRIADALAHTGGHMRKPVYVSLGGLMEEIPISYATPNKDPVTAIDGGYSRVGRKTPTKDWELVRAFGKWLAIKIQDLTLPGLEVGWTFDLERWLTKMSAKGQAFVKRVRALMEEEGLQDEFAVCFGVLAYCDRQKLMDFRRYKIFQKEELYEQVTASRLIFSVTDFLRGVYGDVCACIGTMLSHNKSTLSGVPVNKWAELIWEMMSPADRAVRGSDFTAFESFFVGSIKMLVDHIPYFMMASADTGALMRLNFMRKGEQNKTASHTCFTLETYSDYQRSGSHKTYDVNTFGHLTAANFLLWYSTGHSEPFHAGGDNALDRQLCDLRRLISGDDGIQEVLEDGAPVDSKLWENLGVGFKDESNDWCTGLEVPVSFCKVMCNTGPVAGADLWEVINKLRWVTARVLRAKNSKLISLHRAKMLSYLYKYPSAPIISAICSKFLYITRSIDDRVALRHMDGWDRKKYDEAKARVSEVLREAQEEADARAEKDGGTPKVDRWPLKHHLLYKKPSQSQFVDMSRDTKIDGSVLERVHLEIDFTIEDGIFRCPALAQLKPYAPEGHKFVWDKYVTTFARWEAGLWAAPELAKECKTTIQALIETGNGKADLAYTALQLLDSSHSMERH